VLLARNFREARFLGCAASPYILRGVATLTLKAFPWQEKDVELESTSCVAFDEAGVR